MIYDALGRFIKREGLAIPHGDAGMQLYRIVRFDRSTIGFIELDGRAGESLVRVPAGTLHLRFLTRIEMRSDVRLLLAVGHLDGGRGRSCLFKGLRNDNSDVLTVVTNDIIFEGRPSFVQIRV